MGLAAGALMGLVNGVLIAYVGLPPFVVTLGMLSAVRSLAVVLSENRMLYDFRPDQAAAFKFIGGGDNLGLDASACISDSFVQSVPLHGDPDRPARARAQDEPAGGGISSPSAATSRRPI